jgi:hypothetical protein
MATNETAYPPRNLHPSIRWAAITGIALLVLRRLASVTFPNFLPSNAWRPESWWAGLLASAIFELVLLVFLLGVPFCIYFFRLRNGHGSVRDLLIDCAAAASLYLTALLLL